MPVFARASLACMEHLSTRSIRARREKRRGPQRLRPRRNPSHLAPAEPILWDREESCAPPAGENSCPNQLDPLNRRPSHDLPRPRSPELARLVPLETRPPHASQALPSAKLLSRRRPPPRKLQPRSQVPPKGRPPERRPRAGRRLPASGPPPPLRPPEPSAPAKRPPAECARAPSAGVPRLAAADSANTTWSTSESTAVSDAKRAAASTAARRRVATSSAMPAPRARRI